MLVDCTTDPVAYIEGAPLDPHGTLNLQPHVRIEELELPGNDGTPQLVDRGCGARFKMEERLSGWDVTTVPGPDGTQMVVERHLRPACPYCGKSADYLSEVVKPTELVAYGDALRDEELEEELGRANYRKLSDDAKALIRAGWATMHGGKLRPVVSGGAVGASAGYSHVTEGAVALAAATAKTVIGAKAGAAAGLIWKSLWIGFDGVTASAVPVTLEACYCTWGANSPGTNSTGTTERQRNGRVIAADWTGGRNWTTEPTTLTVIGEGTLSPNGGVIWDRDPLADEPDCALGEGFGLRLTAAAIVNVRATQGVARY